MSVSHNKAYNTFIMLVYWSGSILCKAKLTMQFIFSRDGGQFGGEGGHFSEGPRQRFEADETQTGDPSCAAGRCVASLFFPMK